MVGTGVVVPVTRKLSVAQTPSAFGWPILNDRKSSLILKTKRIINFYVKFLLNIKYRNIETYRIWAIDADWPSKLGSSLIVNEQAEFGVTGVCQYVLFSVTELPHRVTASSY